MMADGMIDEEELAKIHREAKRLHIPLDEVERMIERASQEHELKEDVSALPLHKIATNPAHSIEYFKETLARLRQLGLMVSSEELARLAQDNSRLSAEDWKIWQSINRL